MRKPVYTANQPLALGGQIYMWNRYANSQFLWHMMTAQFTKFGHQSRIELLPKKGAPFYFIIPLKDRSFKPLNDVAVADIGQVTAKLEKTLQSTYGKAPHFDLVMERLGPSIRYLKQLDTDLATPSLATFNLTIHQSIAKWLAPNTRDMFDFTLERPEGMDASQWVAYMGQNCGAHTYIGGGTAKAAYIKDEDFQRADIDYVAQDYKMPEYARKGGDPGTNPMVSILDPLFYLGPEGTLQLIAVC